MDTSHETIRQRDAEIARLKHEIVVLKLRLSGSAAGQEADGTGGTAEHPTLETEVSRLSAGADGLKDNGDSTPQCDAELSASLEINQNSAGIRSASNDADVSLHLPSVGDPSNFEFHTSSPRPGAPSSSDRVPLTASVCDSGTFDCLTSPSVSSKESSDRAPALELEERLGGDWESTERWVEWEEARLREENERRVEELNRHHAAEYQEMKEKYNDKVEALLQKVTDANTRYERDAVASGGPVNGP